MWLILGIVGLVLGIIILRSIVGLLIAGVFFFGMFNYFQTANSSVAVPTYEELVNYPSSCNKADEQLAELRSIQRIKNFSADPDQLNEDDRLYNSRLKASIWWYAYRCDKS